MTESPLIIGLKHPVNLAMLAVVAGAGLLSAWWLLPLGLLLWAFMVFNIASSPRLQYESKAESREQLAPRFQRIYNRLERAQREVLAKLEDSNARSRRALENVRVGLESLADQGYSVLKRLTRMDEYFRMGKSMSSMQNELQHIKDALPMMTNEEVKRDYEMKQVELLDEIERLRTVNDYMERGEGVLEEMADELDRIVAEVINLIGRSPDDVRDRAAEIVRRLQALENRLQSFEAEEVRF
ncbi:MAG: hypothetical protein GYB64_17235 [Chloroflexi bacterium]|nr:hypothetical protein [Chloroflexota bacterium]